MELPAENFHDLRCYVTWFGEDGIARTKVKEGSEITIADAKVNSIIVNKLSEQEKYPMIVDTSGIKSMEKEARDYLAIQDRESRINAIAIIRKTHIGNMIANFFIGLNKPSVPVKLFRNEAEALKWCDKFKST